MTGSSSLNHLHSQQLFEEQLREAEQVRLAQAAEGERDGAARMTLGRLRGLFQAARRVAGRPSLHVAR